MDELKQARLDFYKAARYYCETWEKDFRNARDVIEAQKRLYKTRNDMFVQYRNLMEKENVS